MPFAGLSMNAEELAVARTVFDEVLAEGWDGPPEKLAAIIFEVFRQGNQTPGALKAQTKRKIANDPAN